MVQQQHVTHRPILLLKSSAIAMDSCLVATTAMPNYTYPVREVFCTAHGPRFHCIPPAPILQNRRACRYKRVSGSLTHFTSPHTQYPFVGISKHGTVVDSTGADVTGFGRSMVSHLRLMCASKKNHSPLEYVVATRRIAHVVCSQGFQPLQDHHRKHETDPESQNHVPQRHA